MDYLPSGVLRRYGDPGIDFYFQITNRSRVHLVLDRFSLEVWIGQPLFRGAILTRHQIPVAQNQDTIHFWDQLTVAQQAQIRRRVQGEHIIEPVTVDVTMFFTSSFV